MKNEDTNDNAEYNKAGPGSSREARKLKISPYLRDMESVRQSKVARLIQKELAEIFRSEARSLFGGAFISVTVVRVTPDLGVAKIYLSIMGANKDKAFGLVNENNSMIRRKLGALIGKQVRVIPELHFYIDDSLDYSDKIDELLKK